MKRLIEQESCEHKEFETCDVVICTNPNTHMHYRSEGCFCPGGSSREITVDLSAATKKHRELCTDDGWPTVNGIKEIIDAALGGGW